MEPLELRPSPPQSDSQPLGDHVPDATVGPDAPRPALPSWRVARGMPRRFGVGSILAVTVTYAVVFSVASMLGAPQVVMALLFLLLVVVTAAQALLFGGKHPRWASALAGGLFLVLLLAYGLFQNPLPASTMDVMRWVFETTHSELARTVVFWLRVLFPVLCVVAAFFGYLAGGVVAGTFVILDLAGRILKRLRP